MVDPSHKTAAVAVGTAVAAAETAVAVVSAV